MQELPSYTPSAAEQQREGSTAALPRYSEPLPTFNQTGTVPLRQQPVAPGFVAGHSVSPPAWQQPPPSSTAAPATTAYSTTISRQEVGQGGSSSSGSSNSNFFDNLLSPQRSATMPGDLPVAELPPLPTYIGTTVAHGDTMDQLHGAIVSKSSKCTPFHSRAAKVVPSLNTLDITYPLRL